MMHANDNDRDPIAAELDRQGGRIAGLVTHIDPMDAGRSLGATLRDAQGRDHYVALAANTPVADIVLDALEYGDEIEVSYGKPEHRRLGQPLGTVHQARVLREAVAA